MIKYSWSFKNNVATITKTSVRKLHHLFVTDLDYYEVLSPKLPDEKFKAYWSHSLFDSVDQAKQSLGTAIVDSVFNEKRKGGKGLSPEEIQAIVDSAVIK